MDDMFCNYLNNEYGILLLIDKSSYAIGINSMGQKLSIGGWSSSIADDGGEYYIGLSAVKAVIHEYEMLGGRTMLTDIIKYKLRINDFNELKYMICYKKLSDKRICSLSKEVTKCAALGDRISINILECAANQLFNMADVIIRRLGMYDSLYNLCLAGNINKFGEYITKPFCDKIYSRYDNIQIFTYNNVKQKSLL